MTSHLSPTPSSTPSPTRSLRRPLRLAVAASVTASVALLAPAGAAQAAGGSVAGTWTGPVYGDNGGPAGYTMIVKLKKKNGRVVGKVSYPGAGGDCKGTWTPRKVRGKTYTFVEKISKGACVDDVAVKAKLKDSALAITFKEKGGDTATVVATRS